MLDYFAIINSSYSKSFPETVYLVSHNFRCGTNRAIDAYVCIVNLSNICR